MIDFSSISPKQHYIDKTANLMSGKPYYVRLIASPFIGTGTVMVALIAKIANIAEASLKGCLNVIGARFTQKCSTKIGVKMLRLVPKHTKEFFILVVMSIPFAISVVDQVVMKNAGPHFSH